MSPPAPPPPSHRDAYRIGEVEVHPNAVIALGALLLAEPGSKITIAAGVCIGMGSILHASGGVLEICEGVNLGTGVLLIGSGKVGNYACIGSSSTVINPDLKVAQVLPPGSLLGDASRIVEVPAVEAGAVEMPGIAAWVVEEKVEEIAVAETNANHAAIHTANNSQPQPTVKPADPIYGRSYVQQMLRKLHPPTSGT